MTDRQKLFGIIAGLCVLAIAGCASTQSLRPLGFLKDPNLLRKSPSYEDFYFYKDPSVKLSKYSSVIVEPVLVSGLNVKLDQYDEQRISAYFTNEIKIALSRRYHVTDEPGWAALRLRSVVQVWASEPLLNIHWSTALTGVGVGGASMEAELADSVNGKAILMFASQRKGDRFQRIDGLTAWTHTEHILHDWALQIADTFDGFHGKGTLLF